MSAKIYGGLRALATDPFRAGQQAREVLEPIFFSNVKNLAAFIESKPDEELSELFLVPEGLKRQYNAAGTAFAVLEALQAGSYSGGEFADIGYNFLLMPSAADERILAHVYNGPKAYRAALIASGYFEDFSYWDNSDKDDNVSAEEWAHREASWAHLLKGNVTPASIGLGFQNPALMTFELWSMGLS